MLIKGLNEGEVEDARGCPHEVLDQGSAFQTQNYSDRGFQKVATPLRVDSNTSLSLTETC